MVVAPEVAEETTCVDGDETGFGDGCAVDGVAAAAAALVVELAVAAVELVVAAAELVAVVGAATVDVVDVAGAGCVNAGVIGETAAAFVVDEATGAKSSAVGDAVVAAAVVGEAVAGCNRFRIARHAELV